LTETVPVKENLWNKAKTADLVRRFCISPTDLRHLPIIARQKPGHVVSSHHQKDASLRDKKGERE